MNTTAFPAQQPAQPERPSGRHPVNVGHLVMGIAFLGLVGVWALIQSDVVGNDDVRWLLPVPWVLAGLAGLLAVGLSSSRKWGTRQTGWVDTTASQTDTEADPEADPEIQPENEEHEENR